MSQNNICQEQQKSCSYPDGNPQDTSCSGACKTSAQQEQTFALGQELLRLLPGAILFILALGLEHLPQLPDLPGLSMLLFILAYLLVGWDILLSAGRNIVHGRIFDEFFLMGLATLGALAIQAYAEAVAVMLFFKVGELFQEAAVASSKRSINSLLQLRPDFARLKTAQGLQEVDPEQVASGDIIQIRPGERVPLDGLLLGQEASLETYALTGESGSKRFSQGQEILSGLINQDGLLELSVSKPYSESTVARILDLVQNAAEQKAPTEKFISRFARYYTPAVVAAALAIVLLPLILYQITWLQQLYTAPPQFSEWFYRGLVFLVISCPCALVISIPLSFFGGIGAASRQGVLVKGANYLEGLNSLRTVIWDKTGTLTQGKFQVQEILTGPGFDKQQVLKLAALGEAHSNHPLAGAILEAAGNLDGSQDQVQDLQEIKGRGLAFSLPQGRVLVGSKAWLQENRIQPEHLPAQGQGCIYVALNQDYAGCIRLSDTLKPGSMQAVQDLRSLGIERHYMLTGDSQSLAADVAQRLGLDGFWAELLPEQKLNKLQELLSAQRPGELLAFVGDGINDAPVLRRADLGVAMGGLGSDAAIEAADIVLMQDEPGNLAVALQVANKTRSVVWQNIFLALGVKLLVLSLGALGLAGMWAAVFADVGVALLAVLNALRVMR
ncbi:MAG: heavy metal translocating P-type ATPase [Desulfohalobiaceae bacterium]